MKTVHTNTISSKIITLFKSDKTLFATIDANTLDTKESKAIEKIRGRLRI